MLGRDPPYRSTCSEDIDDTNLSSNMSAPEINVYPNSPSRHCVLLLSFITAGPSAELCACEDSGRHVIHCRSNYAQTPLRLKVYTEDGGRSHCILPSRRPLRLVYPPTTVQSLTPTTRLGGLASIRPGESCEMPRRATFTAWPKFFQTIRESPRRRSYTCPQSTCVVAILDKMEL